MSAGVHFETMELFVQFVDLCEAMSRRDGISTGDAAEHLYAQAVTAGLTTADVAGLGEWMSA